MLHGQTGFSPHSPMIYRALKVDVCLSWGRLPRAEVKTSLVRTSFSELAGVDAQLTVNQRWHQLNCPGLRLLPCGAGRFVHRWPPVTHIRTLTVSSWSPVNHRATLDLHCEVTLNYGWPSLETRHAGTQGYPDWHTQARTQTPWWTQRLCSETPKTIEVLME